MNAKNLIARLERIENLGERIEQADQLKRAYRKAAKAALSGHAHAAVEEKTQAAEAWLASYDRARAVAVALSEYSDGLVKMQWERSEKERKQREEIRRAGLTPAQRLAEDEMQKSVSKMWQGLLQNIYGSNNGQGGL